MGAQLGAPFFVVQARAGGPVSRETLTHVAGDFGLVLGPQRPNDVLSYDHLSATPLALAGVLVLLALGSAIHLLVTGVRSRRRDVALLKTMGFTRRQARAAVLVQATVLVGLALVVALPVGFVAGRWFWSATAHWLGIAADPAAPVLALALVALTALAVANLVAVAPAFVAARIRPAVALRSE
jgi:ABC-type antimicrobial peptide transport system permease subunit